MSLLELLVAMGLGALVLSLLVQFFLSALKIGQRTVVRGRLQQTGMTAVYQLVRDLQQANAGGITFIPDSRGNLLHCVIHPIEDVSGEGLPQYSSEKLFQYTLDTYAFRLTRRQFDQRKPSPITLKAGEPMRFELEEIQQLLDAPAHLRPFPGVVRFAINSYGVDPQFVGNPLRIELILREADEEIACRRSMVLRNSL